MIFEVNGVNLLPYIAQDGIEVTRNDLDSPDTGRTMDGIMHRTRTAIKTKIAVTCLPLKSTAAQTVLNAIYPTFVNVKYEDPREGVVTKSFYTSSVPATVATVYNDGSTRWNGIKFSLTEQ